MKLQKYIYLLLLLFLISAKPSNVFAQAIDKAKLMEFEDAITKGEAYLTAKDYAKAKAEYQKALTIDPGAKYPKDKLAQIRKVYTDPKDETDFQNAVTKGDQLFQAENYNGAKEQYANALLIKPDNRIVKDKIVAVEKASLEKNTKLKEYNALISEADKFNTEKNYTGALEKYKSAALLNPTESYPANKIAEIENMLAREKSVDENYNSLLNAGDEAYMDRNFILAKTKYEEASKIKPSETYPKSMLERISESVAKQTTEQASVDKENSLRYEAAITSGDKLLKEERLNEALQEYTTATELKPTEVYPKQRIEQINKSLAQREEDRLAELAVQKLAEERRQDSVIAVEAAIKLAEERKQDSIQSAQEASRIAEIKSEQEKQDQLDTQQQLALQQEEARLAELNNQKLAEERMLDSLKLVNESRRINEFNKEQEQQAQEEAQKLALQQQESERIALFNAQELADQQRKDSALLAQAAVDKLEQERLAEIKRIEDEKTQQLEFEKLSQTDKEYHDAIESGNSFYTLEDYPSAIKMFEKASELKPFEEYPKNRLITINNIVQQRLKNNIESYNKFIAAGDLAFQSNVYDKALEEFEKASVTRPEEKYPSLMIERINKLMEDNAIINLSDITVVLVDAQEKKYLFNPVDMRLRKNNYLLIKAKKTSEKAPKIYVNYGKDDQKSGGFVLKGIDSDETTDYLLRISVQDKWYRLENNWISLYPEGGDVEISSIKISQGDIQSTK